MPPRVAIPSGALDVRAGNPGLRVRCLPTQRTLWRKISIKTHASEAPPGAA
jgi:hypothetical protein